VLKDFALASDSDVTSIENIVYLIVFSDESFYIGSTGQCFRRRYGTIRLNDSYLLANDDIKSKLDAGLSYDVYLHIARFDSDRGRLQLEDSLIKEHISSIKCLNMRTHDENFGTRRRCSLVSPQGELVEFQSVDEATRVTGATNHSQISQVLNGRMRSVCGWRLPETEGLTGHAMLQKPCVLIDPNGVEHSFASYQEAERTIGACGVGDLIRGHSTTIKGWHLPGVKPRKYMRTVLISPSGEKVVFPSRLEASKVIGCCNQLVSMLIQGKVKTAKGWTYPDSSPI
jgi:hypothetical protein